MKKNLSPAAFVSISAIGSAPRIVERDDRLPISVWSAKVGMWSNVTTTRSGCVADPTVPRRACRLESTITWALIARAPIESKSVINEMRIFICCGPFRDGSGTTIESANSK